MNTIQLVQKHFNPDLQIEGVLMTMLDARTNLGNQVVEEVKKFFKEKVYKTVIPRNVRLSEAPIMVCQSLIMILDHEVRKNMKH